MDLKKSLAAVAVAAGLAIVPAVAQGPEGRGFGGHKRGFAGKHMGDALGLTEQQKQFAAQLRQESRQQSEPLVAELRQIREGLSVAVKSNNQSEIANLTARQGQLEGQLAANRATSMAKFYAQLTPEQKAKADEMRANMKDRSHRRGARHGGGQQSQ